MAVNSVSKAPSFTGNIILKNKISKTQNYLFNLHRQALENKIKDMPFDIFVEQSKNRKTISIYADVKDANRYVVRKNHQNFERATEYAIFDGKNKSEIYQKSLKINKMVKCEKFIIMNVIFGQFKKARLAEQELAKMGLENFDLFKCIPIVHFTDVPLSIMTVAFVNSMKYKIYKLFSPKTPEEKLFLKLRKDYLKELKAKNEKQKVSNITFPRF